MVAMRLIRRLERVGFIHKMALKLVAVLLWLQLAAEIPEVLNIVLSADDEVFSAMINEAENILRFISNPALDLASLGVSRLETLVSSRNGSLTITGLLTERDRVRASVDENYRMLLKGKKVVTEEDDDIEHMEFGSNRYVGQYSHQTAGQRAGGVNLINGNHGPNYSPGQSSSSSTSAAVEQNPQTRLNPAAQAFIPIVAVNRGTEEERCLYLTFSNGYPLTSSEIATFFREMCETVGGWRHNPRAVETVYVHQGEDGAALFGKVVFCNPYLPNFFLGRQNEVKFILHGRALWCKRFVPKSIRNNLVGSTQGESSQAGGLRFRGAYHAGSLRVGVSRGGRGSQSGRFSPYVRPLVIGVQRSTAGIGSTSRGAGIVAGGTVGQSQGPVGREVCSLGGPSQQGRGATEDPRDGPSEEPSDHRGMGIRRGGDEGGTSGSGRSPGQGGEVRTMGRGTPGGSNAGNDSEGEGSTRGGPESR